eukprot:7344743-Lingulodinium_polyedra.AAC.1
MSTAQNAINAAQTGTRTPGDAIQRAARTCFTKTAARQHPRAMSRAQLAERATPNIPTHAEFTHRGKTNVETNVAPR